MRESFARQVQYVVDVGACLTIPGMHGAETYSLSDAERARCLEITMDICGDRVPVCATVVGLSLRDAIAAARRAEEMGRRCGGGGHAAVGEGRARCRGVHSSRGRRDHRAQPRAHFQRRGSAAPGRGRSDGGRFSEHSIPQGRGALVRPPFGRDVRRSGRRPVHGNRGYIALGARVSGRGHDVHGVGRHPGAVAGRIRRAGSRGCPARPRDRPSPGRRYSTFARISQVNSTTR